MAETIHLRGEGGVIWKMDLPLPHGVDQRLAKGDLRIVDADGNPVSVDPGSDTDPDDSNQGGPPAKNASTEAWFNYVVDVLGVPPDEVDGLKRDELVEKYGGG